MSSSSDNCSLMGSLPFLKLFRCFRISIHPAKLALALMAIFILCVVGWIMDFVCPDSSKVYMTAPGAGQVVMSELDYYAVTASDKLRDFEQQREVFAKDYRDLLKVSLKHPGNFPNLSDKDIDDLLDKGKAVETITRHYDKSYPDSLALLDELYLKQKEGIQKSYNTLIEKDDSDAVALRTKLSGELAQLELVNNQVFEYLTCGPAMDVDQKFEPWLGILLADGQDEVAISDALMLAHANKIADLAQPKGVFSSFLKFKLDRMHRIASALALLDFTAAKNAIVEIFAGSAYMLRMHTVMTYILMLAGLVVWAVFGGAICRITALQITRDEQVGAMHALKFSSSRLINFIGAPLWAFAVIFAFGVVIWLLGWLVVIPSAGAVLAGLVFWITLIAGAVIALFSIGTAMSLNIMFPSVAVEGFDSFDALSRSLNYIYSKPWHLLGYSLISGIYGAICYLFIRMFAFVLLLTTYYFFAASANHGQASNIAATGRLSAMWAKPAYSNLQPAINWNALCGAETFGAVCIWFWVALVALSVLAFAVSFFYSVNTVIYILLRQKVDGVDLEAVYLEHRVEELVAQGLPDEVLTMKTDPVD
ncbi:MAG: hypothetical protein JEZ07_11640 [Phycisphaerae bacterium]|nr:hypothetical protein [Phycisphaerae bacterium]